MGSILDNMKESVDLGLKRGYVLDDFAVQEIVGEIRRLESLLLAHQENEGDECPLCAAEKLVKRYRRGLAAFMHAHHHTVDYHIWQLCNQHYWLKKADEFIEPKNSDWLMKGSKEKENG